MEFPFPAHFSGAGREKRKLGIRFILYRKSIEIELGLRGFKKYERVC